jgi:RIO kinase 1
MRRMYHECNLVHGDLSEYNLLWHNGRAVIIDVSQSVEHSHPYANDFLRKDITNITDFFKKRGVNTLSAYRLFQLITLVDLPGIPVSSVEFSTQQSLHAFFSEIVKSEAKSQGDVSSNLDETEEQRLIDEAVFLQSYIPRSLHEFSNPVAEMNRIAAGGREQVHTDAILTMLGEKVGGAEYDTSSVDSKNDDYGEGSDIGHGENSSTSSDSVDDEWIDDGTLKKYHRCLPGRNDPHARALAKEERRELRRLTKIEAAEKRKVKIPKHVKKRATKGSSRK